MMTRPPNRLRESVSVERITPNRARTMLIHGLIPEDEVDGFKPANLSVNSIITMMHRANEIRNRHVTIDTVLKYARDMSEGNWLWTGEAVQLDHDGFVRNGQHRLLAVVHSGTTQDFLVVRDLEPSAQLVIDVGRSRTTGNQLHLTGISSAHHVTAIANVLLRWRAGRMLNTYQTSVMEVSQLVQAEPTIPDALSMTHRVRRNVPKAPQSALGATYVEAGHVDVDARDLFFELLATGADLEVNDPILTLRNKMQNQVAAQVRFRRAGQLWQIVHTWNQWREGKKIQLLRVPSSLTSDTFPTMK
jgi:hypothetical protein